jgi:hypothetical protein
MDHEPLSEALDKFQRTTIFLGRRLGHTSAKLARVGGIDRRFAIVVRADRRALFASFASILRSPALL